MLNQFFPGNPDAGADFKISGLNTGGYWREAASPLVLGHAARLL